MNKLSRADSSDVIPDLTEGQEIAFWKLMTAVTSPPVLELPKNGLPSSVGTDTSEYKVGVEMFHTDYENNRIEVGFWNRTPKTNEKNSISEKNCFVAVWEFTTMKLYLLLEYFVEKKDHASLRWVMNITDPSGWLIRWRIRLSEFSFEIRHKKGI